ncbi:hypothetical protein [Bacillus rhizoplanae]
MIWIGTMIVSSRYKKGGEPVIKNMNRQMSMFLIAENNEQL